MSITRKSTLFLAIVISLLGSAQGRVVTAQTDDGRKVFCVGVFDGSSAELAEGQPKGNEDMLRVKASLQETGMPFNRQYSPNKWRNLVKKQRVPERSCFNFRMLLRLHTD